MTSREARQALNTLSAQDPEFYAEITRMESEPEAQLDSNTAIEEAYTIEPEHLALDSSMRLEPLIQQTLSACSADSMPHLEKMNLLISINVFYCTFPAIL